MVTFGVQIQPQFGYTYEEVLDTSRAGLKLDGLSYKAASAVLGSG